MWCVSNVCVVLVDAHTKGEISKTTLSFCIGDRLRVYFKSIFYMREEAKV